MADISRIIDAINDIPRRIRGVEIDLSPSQQAAIHTGRKTWRLDQLLGVITHRVGLTFVRTARIEADVQGLTEALLAVGEVSGMDRAAVQKIVADTVARATVSLEIPEEEG